MTGATKRDRSKLGGLTRVRLLHDLAHGDLSGRALAEKYACSEQAISAFKGREAETIAAMRADAEDELAGILIAQKAARLRVYEEMLGDALTPVPKISVKGDTVTVYDPETGEASMVMEKDLGNARGILKQVAEEMGHLPTRVQMSGEVAVTTYRIEGVDPESMR